ncbi:hypothetical protein ACOMHN_045404 [Nucella lapillus]
MGTPMAPTIANIFMGWRDEKMLETCPWTIDPAIWKRYIDDIITIWLYEDSVFEKRCQELKVKLQRRGYPGSLIDAAMRKVSDQPRTSTL